MITRVCCWTARKRKLFPPNLCPELQQRPICGVSTRLQSDRRRPTRLRWRVPNRRRRRREELASPARPTVITISLAPTPRSCHSRIQIYKTRLCRRQRCVLCRLVSVQHCFCVSIVMQKKCKLTHVGSRDYKNEMDRDTSSGQHKQMDRKWITLS